MTDYELEQKLKKAVEAHTPDVLDNILARCDDAKSFSRDYNQPKPINFKRYFSIAAAVAVVIGGIAFGRSMLMPNVNPAEVASVVSFDVNPSVEMQLDAEQNVIDLVPRNDDAEKIVENIDIDNAELDIAVDALLFSMIQQGYIDDSSNSILITVEDADKARAVELQEKVTTEVNSVLTASSVEASILSQHISEEVPEVSQIKENYDISTGKAALVNQITSSNPALSTEILANLSVNELNLLASNPVNTPSEVVTTGTPSQGDYIGTDAAITTALASAGISQSDVIGNISVDFDLENGILVYEVEFKTAEFEYEFDIDASNKTVVNFSTEAIQSSDDDDDNDDTNDTDDDNDDNDDDIIIVNPTPNVPVDVVTPTTPYVDYDDEDDDGDDDDDDNEANDVDDDNDDNDDDADDSVDDNSDDIVDDDNDDIDDIQDDIDDNDDIQDDSDDSNDDDADDSNDDSDDDADDSDSNDDDDDNDDDSSDDDDDK